MSILKVNSIQKVTGTEINIPDPVSGIPVLTVTKIIAQAASSLVAGLMSVIDKNKLDQIASNADVTGTANVTAAGAVMDSDFPGTSGILEKVSSGVYQLATDLLRSGTFTVAGLLRTDAAGAVTVDQTVYTSQNDTISLSGDVTGSGRTGIVASISAAVISARNELTAIDTANDFMLVWDATASALRKVKPQNLGVGGNTTLTGEITGSGSGNVATTLQPAVINNRPQLNGTTVSGADELLLKDNSAGTLSRASLNDIGTAMSWAGGGGGGGTTGAGIDFGSFYTAADGHLYVQYYGSANPNDFSIDSNGYMHVAV